MFIYRLSSKAMLSLVESETNYVSLKKHNEIILLGYGVGIQ